MPHAMLFYENPRSGGLALAMAYLQYVNCEHPVDGDEYNIRVRYDPQWRTSIEDIQNIDIYTPMGKAVRVSELGTVEEMQTPPSIVRKNRERMVKLTCIVKDGIVLLDFTIILRKRGMALKDAVVTACKARLRPILMTSLTTILGMVPLAVGQGEGSEMWHGLGITVIWGLTVSSLITLVYIPVMYTSFCRKDEK